MKMPLLGSFGRFLVLASIVAATKFAEDVITEEADAAAGKRRVCTISLFIKSLIKSEN